MYVINRAIDVASRVDDHITEESDRDWQDSPELRGILAMLEAIGKDELLGIAALFRVAFSETPLTPVTLQQAVEREWERMQESTQADFAYVTVEFVVRRAVPLYKVDSDIPAPGQEFASSRALKRATDDVGGEDKLVEVLFSVLRPRLLDSEATPPPWAGEE